METNGLSQYRTVIEDARETDEHWAAEIVRDTTTNQQLQLFVALVDAFGIDQVRALVNQAEQQIILGRLQDR